MRRALACSPVIPMVATWIVTLTLVPIGLAIGGPSAPIRVRLVVLGSYLVELGLAWLIWGLMVWLTRD